MKEINYKKILIYIIRVLFFFYILGLISFIFHGNIQGKKDEYNCSGPTSSFYKCFIEILQFYSLLISSIFVGTNLF